MFLEKYGGTPQFERGMPVGLHSSVVRALARLAGGYGFDSHCSLLFKKLVVEVRCIPCFNYVDITYIYMLPLG